MSLRVLESDAQGRWREEQPSWNSTHQRKKQNKGQPQATDQAQDQPGPGVYNAKGDLMPIGSSLEIDV